MTRIGAPQRAPIPFQVSPFRMLIDGITTEQIPASDRGLHYGDGLFETIAVAASRPRLWERHMARLAEGERRLGLPPLLRDLLWSEAESLISGAQQGVLKILHTRGSGGRGYRSPTSASTRRILSFHPWPEFPRYWFREGIELRLCDTRLGINPALAGIKHLCRLEQVLARNEWDDPAIPEGVMLDIEGRVIEGTQSNLFLLKNGGLITPDLSRCGVAGVMRGLVLESARALGIDCLIRDLGVDELGTADGVFICNSLIGIVLVARFAAHKFDPKLIPSELVETVRQRAFGQRDATLLSSG